jgi:4-hydroxybenzoate polyprenyltransferase
MARRSPPQLAAPGDAPAGAVPGRPVAISLLTSLRPEQWTKNLVVFAGLLFGLKLFDLRAVVDTAAAFAIFCALSGVVYLVNDVADRDRDRRHPFKKYRPIASGALSPATAIAAAIGLGVVAVAASFWMSPKLGIVAAAYLTLMGLYSGSLKHIVIIDVLALAMGFVLRAVAGAVVINVPISQWLLACTILLALFLALSKRRHELVLLADAATEHRRILQEYSPYLLDQMIGVVTASTLVAYIFYTISPETQQKFGTSLLGLTVPFAIYFIFRYLYLVHQKEGGGSPAETLLNDRPLLLCVVLWAAAVAFIIYAPEFLIVQPPLF